jgi:hypothetical protein
MEQWWLFCLTGSDGVDIEPGNVYRWKRLKWRQEER